MRAISRRQGFPKLDRCWRLAPPVSSPEFLPVYGAISNAIQATLRDRLAPAYFADTRSFSDVRKAYPMLVYQASRPFRPRTKTDLTYDILNPKMTRMLFRSVRKNLTGLLASVEARLLAEGAQELAEQYTPKRAAYLVKFVKRLADSRRYLYGLIRSESTLVEALVRLGGLADVPAAERRIHVAGFAQKWNFQVRRLYRRKDFVWLGPELLDAATHALRAATAREPAAHAPFLIHN